MWLEWFVDSLNIARVHIGRCQDNMYSCHTTCYRCAFREVCANCEHFYFRTLRIKLCEANLNYVLVDVEEFPNVYFTSGSVRNDKLFLNMTPTRYFYFSGS